MFMFVEGMMVDCMILVCLSQLVVMFELTPCDQISWEIEYIMEVPSQELRTSHVPYDVSSSLVIEWICIMQDQCLGKGEVGNTREGYQTLSNT